MHGAFLIFYMVVQQDKGLWLTQLDFFFKKSRTEVLEPKVAQNEFFF